MRRSRANNAPPHSTQCRHQNQPGKHATSVLRGSEGGHQCSVGGDNHDAYHNSGNPPISQYDFGEGGTARMQMQLRSEEPQKNGSRNNPHGEHAESPFINTCDADNAISPKRLQRRSEKVACNPVMPDELLCMNLASIGETEVQPRLKGWEKRENENANRGKNNGDEWDFHKVGVVLRAASHGAATTPDDSLRTNQRVFID